MNAARLAYLLLDEKSPVLRHNFLIGLLCPILIVFTGLLITDNDPSFHLLMGLTMTMFYTILVCIYSVVKTLLHQPPCRFFLGLATGCLGTGLVSASHLLWGHYITWMDFWVCDTILISCTTIGLLCPYLKLGKK